MKTEDKNHIISKKIKKDNKVFNSISEKKIETSNENENNVSVFTKTTNPKVIIQSENLGEKLNLFAQNIDKHQILKLCCLIIMSIILLMTFFLSLKTYNAVNELSNYILL